MSCLIITGSRSGKITRELLGYYRGVMQCDGYTVYEQFEQMAEGHLLNIPKELY